MAWGKKPQQLGFGRQGNRVTTEKATSSRMSGSWTTRNRTDSKEDQQGSGQIAVGQREVRQQVQQGEELERIVKDRTVRSRTSR